MAGASSFFVNLSTLSPKTLGRFLRKGVVRCGGANGPRLGVRAIGALLLIFATSAHAWGDRLPYEKIMRQIQARAGLLYNSPDIYTLWPAGPNGEMAPLFPADNFYGDNLTAEKKAQLASSMRIAFGAVASDAPEPGDLVKIANVDSYSEVHPAGGWANEFTIYLGSNTYLANGTTHKFESYDEIEQGMIEEDEYLGINPTPWGIRTTGRGFINIPKFVYRTIPAVKNWRSLNHLMHYPHYNPYR